MSESVQRDLESDNEVDDLCEKRLFSWAWVNELEL